jgi:capsular polysaccharide biosynthesis protein
MTHGGNSWGMPGSRLLRFAEEHLDHSAVEILVLPIIADIQHEYSAVSRTTMMRLFVLLRGYWSFWKVIGLHMVMNPHIKGSLMIGSSMKRWQLLIFAVIIFAGVATYGFLRPMMYRSETRIMMEPTPTFYGNLSAAEIKDRVEIQFQNIKQMLESRTMLARIVAEFSLREVSRTSSLENTLGSIRKNLYFLRVSENVFTLSYRSHDPETAQAITRRMAEILINANQMAMRTKADERDQFLEQELRQAESKLADSIKRVSLVKTQGSPEQQLLLLEQARLQRHVDEIDRMRFNARMEANAMNNNEYRILDHASFPEGPIFPTRADILWMGFAATLVVALPAAFMKKKGPPDSAQATS